MICMTIIKIDHLEMLGDFDPDDPDYQEYVKK